MYSKEVERVGTFGKMEIKNFFHQIAKLNLRHCKYIRTSQQDQSVPLTVCQQGWVFSEKEKTKKEACPTG